MPYAGVYDIGLLEHHADRDQFVLVEEYDRYIKGPGSGCLVDALWNYLCACSSFVRAISAVAISFFAVIIVKVRPSLGGRHFESALV